MDRMWAKGHVRPCGSPAWSHRRIACSLLLAILHMCKSLGAVEEVRHHQTFGMMLESGMMWKDCLPTKLEAASSTEQVASIVSSVYEEVEGSSVEMVLRASRNGYLTHNNLSCPVTTNKGLSSTVIDMSSMAAVLEYPTEGSVKVQAGITFEALEEELLQHKLGLSAIGLTPHIASSSVGGALMTSSHGSSLVGPASIAPYITHATLVDGTGRVHELEQPGPLLEGSLGLLGVVTDVTLRYGHALKVFVKEVQGEDQGLLDDINALSSDKEVQSLDVTWSPTLGLYTARLWKTVPDDTPGDARNAYLQGTAGWVKKTNKKLVQQLQEPQRSSSNGAAPSTGPMCDLLREFVTMSHFSTTPPGKKRARAKTKKAAAAQDGSSGEALPGTEQTREQGTWVGYAARMSGIRCPEGAGCLWKRAKYLPYVMTIRREDLAGWVSDVRAIMQQAGGCPIILVHLRFLQAAEAPLALSHGGDTVSVEFATFSGVGPGLQFKPVPHQALLEELLQVTLCSYKARPHGAHSTSRLLVAPGCPLRDTLGSSWDAFEAQRAQHDPEGVLSPPLWKAVAARSTGSFYPGCAVMGDCFCQADWHCAPNLECVPGRVFSQYKVCAPEEGLPDLDLEEGPGGAGDEPPGSSEL